MLQLMRSADDVLRQKFDARKPIDARSLALLASCIITFGSAYGAVMGTFGGFGGDRAWQVAFSAAKVPLLLMATFAIAAPNFLVINTLAGLRQDLPEVLRALIATQAGVAIVLASLSPVTVLWYISSTDYPNAILFNGIVFAVACVAGQYLLRAYYAPLIARDPRHRVLCRLWLGLYAFVGIQMGWILRPFVGDPGASVQFLRDESWGNAYVVVVNILINALP